MVIVNRARDSLLERIVAVKTILLDRDAGDRTECEARFLQEAVPTPPGSSPSTRSAAWTMSSDLRSTT
jgi:hypothetical protein